MLRGLGILGLLSSSVYAFLLPRADVELAVPLSGNLSGTAAHYDPVTWTLYSQIFNQTTWVAQPYVPPFPFYKLTNRYQMGTSAIVYQRKAWDTGKQMMKP